MDTEHDMAMPRSLVKALWILFFLYVIGTISALIDYFSYDREYWVEATLARDLLVGIGISTVIYGLMAWVAIARMWWGRGFWTVLLILGLMMCMIFGLGTAPEDLSNRDVTVLSVSFVGYLVQLYLIYQYPNEYWFRKLVR